MMKEEGRGHVKRDCCLRGWGQEGRGRRRSISLKEAYPLVATFYFLSVFYQCVFGIGNKVLGFFEVLTWGYGSYVYLKVSLSDRAYSSDRTHMNLIDLTDSEDFFGWGGGGLGENGDVGMGVR